MSRQAAAAGLPMLVLMLVVLGVAPAFANQGVEAADRNDDGEVDRREFEERMVDVFFMMDADKNGGLAPSEVPRVTSAAFRRVDLDGDGKLQLEEFLEARAADFERADADDDGRLDAMEATAYDEAAG